MTHKKSFFISNELFFKEVKALLDAKKKVNINVQGDSMRPFLRNGDKVLLSRAETKNICRGRVVLAQTLYGIVLHRVVRLEPPKIVLAGDANAKQLEWVAPTDVLAVAIAAFRDEKDLKLYSLKKRLVALLWIAVRPFRGYLLRGYYWLNKK